MLNRVITLNVSYSRLVALRKQGRLPALLEEKICPSCGQRGLLRLMKSQLKRGVVCPNQDGVLVAATIWVSLVRCDGGEKRHWHRVLPCEIQPRKTYSTPSMELTMANYHDGKNGLRKAIKALPESKRPPAGERRVRPHYSTLWHWLGGIGEYGRGRDAPPGVVPFGTVLAETKRHGRPELLKIWSRKRQVPPERYRSEERREGLEYARRVMATAKALFPDETFPMTAWSSLILGFGFSAGLGWFTTRMETGIQLPRPGRSEVIFLPSEKAPRREEKCPTRMRSPPGGSNR
jgi:hypothetical protein